MSQTITIDGVAYVPAVEAGRHFGYTKIYILNLVKQGDIVGKKIGQKWYVNLASGERYFTNAHARRREQLETMRREGQARVRKYEHTRASHHKRTAVLHTLLILIIGLSIGATGYLGTVSIERASATESNTNIFEQLARSLYAFISGNREPVAIGTTSVDVTDTVLGGMAINDREAGVTTTSGPRARALGQSEGVIIAPESALTAESINALRDSFADSVTITIDPNIPDTGTIVPHFKSSDGEAYRFLMVPVIQN